MKGSPDSKGKSGLGSFLLGDKGEASEPDDMPKDDEGGDDEAQVQAAQAALDAIESKDSNAFRNAVRDLIELLK